MITIVRLGRGEVEVEEVASTHLGILLSTST